MPSPPPIGTPASNARAAVGAPTRATPSLPGIRAAAARAAAQRAMSPFMPVNPATGLAGQIMAVNAARQAAGRLRQPALPRYRPGILPGSMAAAYANQTPNQGIDPR